MIKVERLSAPFPPYKHVQYEFDELAGWYILIKTKKLRKPENMLPEHIKGVRLEVYTPKYGTDRAIVDGQCTENESAFVAPVTEAMYPRWHIGSVDARAEGSRKWSYTVLFYQHDLTGRLHVFFFTEPNIKTNNQRTKWANEIIPELRRSFNAREVEL